MYGMVQLKETPMDFTKYITLTEIDIEIIISLMPIQRTTLPIRNPKK